MVECAYSGKKISFITGWECHRCNKEFCYEYRLPENHECTGPYKRFS